MLTPHEYVQLKTAIDSAEGLDLSGRCAGFYILKNNVIALLQQWTDFEFEKLEEKRQTTE